MKKQLSFLILPLALLLVIVAGGVGYKLYRAQKFIKEEVPIAVSPEDIQKNPASTLAAVATTTAVVEAPNLPPSLNLSLPFYTQAPFGNWDFPWQEACEEASILLVANAYFKHGWSKSQFNDEILKMVEWEEGVFGTYLDTTVAQTARILNDYLGLKTVTHTNPTLADIQKILARGHLIVMFFAGKELHNPNFKNGGPVYHALVVKGYKEGDKVITHDVGTRNGADYVYHWSTLQNAMHDFANPIQTGAKRILEVLPPYP